MIFSETNQILPGHICRWVELLCFHLNWNWRVIHVWEINLKPNWLLWPIFPSISCIIWTFKFIPSHMDGCTLQIKLARVHSFMFVLISTHREDNCFCAVILHLQTLWVSVISSLLPNSCRDTVFLTDNSYCPLNAE